MKIFTVAAMMLTSIPALAAEVTIEMLNKDADGNKMVYSQEIARVDVGDTITWVPTTKGHNVEMIASPNRMKLKSKKTSKMPQLTQLKVTYSGTLTLSSLSYHWMEKQIDTIRWD